MRKKMRVSLQLELHSGLIDIMYVLFFFFFYKKIRLSCVCKECPRCRLTIKMKQKHEKF